MATSVGQLALKVSVNSGPAQEGLAGLGRKLQGYADRWKHFSHLSVPDKIRVASGHLGRGVASAGKSLGGKIGGRLGSSIASMTSKLGPAISSLGELGAGAAALSGPVLMAAAAVAAVYAAGIALAAKASPAKAAQLGDAWDDLLATLGDYFMPLLDDLIPAVRGLGDVLATLKPIIMPVIRALSALSGIGLFGKLAAWATENGLLTSSVGRAADPSQFGTARSYADKAYAAAASSGSSVPEQQLKQAEKTNQILLQLQRVLLAAAKVFGGPFTKLLLRP